MKLTTLLLFISLSTTAQNIDGVWLNWMGLLQDISDQSNLKISNLSRIVYDDGTQADATEASPFTWVWSRMTKDANGHWQRNVIDTAFAITPSQFIPELCHGVFVIELEAIHDDGRIWRCQGPCSIIWTNGCSPYLEPEEQVGCIPLCPDLIPTLPFNVYNENMWVTQDQLRRAFTSNLWYSGLDYVGENGDLDNDGDVDTSDLLIFISKYGN